MLFLGMLAGTPIGAFAWCIASRMRKRHKCAWDSWGKAKEITFKGGGYGLFQYRTCFGCGVTEERRVDF